MEKHRTIRRLLARQGKKAPFGDGGKIALVLPGGLMTGVNGAGAMIALEKLGLSQAFDVIYTASAGFGNAAYLLTENSKVGASVYYEELSARRFINLFHIWNPFQIEVVVNAIRSEKKLSYSKIWNADTELYLRVRDRLTKTNQYFSIQNQFQPSQFFKLFESAISFPIFTSKKRMRFCDGQTTDQETREHFSHAIQQGCTDVLIIYNNLSQVLVSTVRPGKVCEIFPPKVSMISRFETRPEVLQSACKAMTARVLQEFT